MLSFRKSVSCILLSAALAFVLIAAACAFSAPEEAAPSAPPSQSGFVPVSKDEYIGRVAKSTGLSTAEVLQELQQTAFELRTHYGASDDGAAASSDPAPAAGEYQGDGITFLYGYVYFTDTYAHAFQVQSRCYAVIARHPQGELFAAVAAETAEVFAYNGGAWELESPSVHAAAQGSSSVQIDYSGVIGLSYEEAQSIGADPAFFADSASAGKSAHLRQFVSAGNTYTL